MEKEEKYTKRIEQLESELLDLKLQLENAKTNLNEEFEKRRYYQFIADFTFSWELWYEPDSSIIYCSPSCFDLTGFTANQVLASPGISEMLVYEPDRIDFNIFLEKSLDQQLVNQSIQFRILTRTKQLRWCQMNVRSVYDQQGKYLGIRASIHDISKLKQAFNKIHNLETDKHFTDLTKSRMQNEMHQKDRELVSFLLQLSQQNELLAAIKKQFLKIDQQGTAEQKNDLKSLLTVLETKQNQLIEWGIVENQVEKIYPGFLHNLHQKHPRISSNDKKICAYLKLGLSNKEISGLLNITPKSVEVARTRLRKKLRVSSKTRLVTYLANL